MKKLNVENFEEVVTNEKGFFIIKFSSPTCGPCKTMNPVFEALSNNNPDLNIYEIDTMESPELADHFGVRGVPYITFCENREVIYSFTGTTPLGNLQYVINNINDPYFREHGEFHKERPKTSPWFALSVVAVIIFFITVYYLA
ncbi:MAG: thioredoxin family protein [Bacteriovoracaceae bacterium]|nr:thioredoxin family protein [Bacteriovoracaceae bacterium]